VLGLRGLSVGEAGLVAAVALFCGALLAGFGLFRLVRGERTTMILRPDAMAIPGLDAAIRWDDIADLDLSAQQTGVVTRLLLRPDAQFPQRVPGGRKIKLDPKRRIVTVTAGLPRKMTLQNFADLIGRYRYAAEARRILAQTGTLPVHPAS
jgi:hypothetical protein